MKYMICYSPLSWHDPESIHYAKPQPGYSSFQRVEAAAWWQKSMNHRYHPMRLNTMILAELPDGDFRFLTDEEEDRRLDVVYAPECKRDREQAIAERLVEMAKLEGE